MMILLCSEVRNVRYALACREIPNTNSDYHEVRIRSSFVIGISRQAKAYRTPPSRSSGLDLRADNLSSTTIASFPPGGTFGFVLAADSVKVKTMRINATQAIR